MRLYYLYKRVTRLLGNKNRNRSNLSEIHHYNLYQIYRFAYIRLVPTKDHKQPLFQHQNV